MLNRSKLETNSSVVFKGISLGNHKLPITPLTTAIVTCCEIQLEIE